MNKDSNLQQTLAFEKFLVSDYILYNTGFISVHTCVFFQTKRTVRARSSIFYTVAFQPANSNQPSTVKDSVVGAVKKSSS